MGADLVVSCISFSPEIDLHKDKDNIKQRMINYIKSMRISKEEYSFLYDYLGTDEEEPEEIRKTVIDIVSSFFDCIFSREVCILEYPERNIILSGGMSCGDLPTESCIIIDRVGLLPQHILDIGKFGRPFDIFEIFMDKHKDTLTEDLKQRLIDWRFLQRL